MHRIHLLSDLHLEFHRDLGNSFVDHFCQALDQKVKSEEDKFDLLILAGDIVPADLIHRTNLFSFIKEYYKYIIYTSGNHEYYGTSISEGNNMIEDHVAKYDNVFYLQNDILDLSSDLGFRVLGTTLWFDFDNPLAPLYAQFLNDFGQIQDLWTDGGSASLEADSFLKENIQEGDIVVTHHSPSLQSICPKFKMARTNIFYHKNLDELIIDTKPRMWNHGHTHSSCHYNIEDTLISTNPMGYLRGANIENSDFLLPKEILI